MLEMTQAVFTVASYTFYSLNGQIKQLQIISFQLDLFGLGSFVWLHMKEMKSSDR